MFVISVTSDLDTYRFALIIRQWQLLRVRESIEMNMLQVVQYLDAGY